MPAEITFDPDTFRSWLATQLTEDQGGEVADVQVLGLHRSQVGQSSATLLFEATWHAPDGAHAAELVLRVQPPPDGIFLHPDAAREFRVLDGLRHYPGVPVPRVRWLETDPAVLGAPFFVMDKLSGIVPAGKPSIHVVGWLPTLEPDHRRRLAQSAIGSLAQVHAVDWRATHSFLQRDPTRAPDLAAHLAHLVEWHRWTVQGRSFEIVDAALAFVLDKQSAVTPTDPVLLWGDARLGNTMFDPGTLTVAALLDWEVASLGPAGVDLAHWLVFDEFATTAGGVTPLAGYPDRDTVVGWYETASGRPALDLPYFEILQCLFLAITLIRQADASVRAGRLSPNTRMGHDNTLTQMLARRLDLPVPELAPDYLRHRQPASAPGR